MAWGDDDELVAVAEPSASWGNNDEIVSLSSEQNSGWGKADPEITPPPHADLLDLFGYKVAVGGISAVQGLLRGLSSIASDEQKRKVTDDAADALEEYKKKTLPAYYGVTPEDEKTTAGSVAGATASVFDMAAGPAIMISKMAGQTFSDSYDRSVHEQLATGEIDPAKIRENARKQAAVNVAKMSPVLAAYALGGKIAGKGAELIAPETGPLVRGLVGATTSTAANLAVSGGVRAVEGQPVIGDLEQNLTDAFFGATGGLHEAFREVPPARARDRAPDRSAAVEPPPADVAAGVSPAEEPARSMGIPMDHPAASDLQPEIPIEQLAERRPPVEAAVPSVSRQKKFVEYDEGIPMSPEMRANIDAVMRVIPSPVKRRIEDLFAQDLTAAQVAKELGMDAAVIRKVRAGMGIPARTAFGSPTVRPEFLTWKAARELPPETAAATPPNFRADESIPFMTKVRIEDDLKTRGLAEEQIAALTSVEVQNILANVRPMDGGGPAPPRRAALTSLTDTRSELTSSRSEALEPATPPPAPASPPGVPRPVSQPSSQPEITPARPPVTLKSFADIPDAAVAAEAEHRAELLSDANAAQAGQGAELMDAIARAGGLPAKKWNQPLAKYQPFARAETFAGELERINEAARNPQRSERLPLNKIFRADAPDIDELATRLRDQGFDVQTPGDLLSLVEQRVTSGKPLYGLPEQARLFASGSAAPKARSEQGKVFAAGAAKPVPPGAAAQPTVGGHRPPLQGGPTAPSPVPAVQAAVAPLRTWWQQRTLGIRKLVAPQTIDLPARRVANIVRDYNGQLANRIAQADEALAVARKDFDRTPVPRSWQYDPAQPLPRNYAFMAESEKGGATLSTSDRALKTQMDAMFAEAVDEVHRVKPAALKSLIQDYFPHIWKDPKAAQQAFAGMVGHRPLEGSKSFLKQRALAYIEDGLKLGLEPVSDNPVDMVLTKLHEVHKFVAAQDMLTEAKAIGARKFVYIFEKAPEDWVKVDDPTSTVNAPPFVTVPEAFDEQMKVKTLELLNQLGIKHERVAKLGGKRWGTFENAGGGIRTKFAGPLSVYWHELGHGLEERYGWLSEILRGERPGGKSIAAVELRRLADLRSEGQPPNKSFKSYARSADEKAAVMLEAYMHAPRKMQDVAPVIYGRVKKFIAAHPELRAIEDIRPSLVLGTGKQRIDVGGMVTLGHYYMPEGAATVFNNYLMPGLQRFGIIRNIRTSTNILSGLQLGFSAFHAGFTSIDAAVSQFALALRYASEGKVGKAIEKTLTAPIAPVTNYLSGRKVQRAMLEPGYGTPEIQEIAQLAVKAGLRATVDPFWKTQITRNMMRAWHEGGVKGYTGTILRAPFAISEQMMRPILEYLVPRQKLGVFAGMAVAHMERLGPNADVHAVRDALARAADSTEDRMGQMTYDNLFYNRYIRDAALLGFRAYGWTFGKYRALFGGFADILHTPSRLKADGPVLTDRMAYLIALPMVAGAIGSVMNYAMTGQPPQDWKDALMPRTGRLDRNGNPQRLSLPTYIKDILSDWHDFPDTKKMLESFSHKLNPWFSVAHDIIANADFFGTKVYNEGDPFWKQQAEKAQFVLKSAQPFAVTSTMRLNESHPALMQQVLPFFGFVPAKAALTMTPAQTLAVELMGEMLPRGARTQEEADHSKLVAELVRDMKEQDPRWKENLGVGLFEGKLTPRDLHTILTRLPLTPMQYQVKRLGAEDAMKVWDLASDQERQQLFPIVLMKVTSPQNDLKVEQRLHFLEVLKRTAPRQQ